VRTRSITGPLVLVVIGFLFLINNVWRDVPFWSLMWDYWPVLVIVVGVIGLVEALYHASRGVVNPPRPLAGVGVVWIVMLVALASWGGNHGNFHFGPFNNGGINVLGTDYEYDVNAVGASQGITRVVLDNLHGNLSLKGQDAGGDVKVSGKKSVRAFSKTDADRADRESPVRVDRQGDLLIIHADEPKSSHMLSVSADLDITIPKGVDVESRGRTGDLTIDDIGGDVEINSGRGDVRLSNIAKDVKVDSTRGGLIRAVDIKGKVDLQGRGGDIQLENVQGQVTINGEYSGTLEFHALAKSLHFQSKSTDFRLEGVPGNITLDLGELKMTNVTGPVRFQTGTRDIQATDVSGGLEISVQRGDVQVTESKMLPKLEIHSHNGDVTLAIPEKAGFELEGTTRQGEVSNDFGDPLKSEQDGRAASIKGKQGNGPQINIGTDRGTLTVKKS
jgi:DUF4097 and DUF4098 domain-containing protein YvlB